MHLSIIGPEYADEAFRNISLQDEDAIGGLQGVEGGALGGKKRGSEGQVLGLLLWISHVNIIFIRKIIGHHACVVYFPYICLPEKSPRLL